MILIDLSKAEIEDALRNGKITVCVIGLAG